MAETQTAPAATEEKKAGVIAKAGLPVRGSFPGAEKAGVGQVANETGKEPAAAPPGADAGKQPPAAGKEPAATAAPAPKFEDIQAFLKEQGIEGFDSFEALKKKITQKEPEQELTQEQKDEQVKLKNKRLLDLHIARGGTPEQYVNFQKQAAAEVADLGKIKLMAELKKEGFSDAEAEDIFAQMHFQVSDEDIIDLKPEQQELIKKQRALGLKKLANRGTYLKNSAQSYFDDLNREATELDAETTTKKQHATNVDAYLSTFQRKETFDLGKVEDEIIPPYETEIPETVLAQVKEKAKDLGKLKTQLVNKDGSVNVDFLLPLMIKAEAYSQTAKASYMEATDRAVKHIQGKFGSKPVLGGPSGTANGTPGKITSAGKPQKARLG